MSFIWFCNLEVVFMLSRLCVVKHNAGRELVVRELFKVRFRFTAVNAVPVARPHLVNHLASQSLYNVILTAFIHLQFEKLREEFKTELLIIHENGHVSLQVLNEYVLASFRCFVYLFYQFLEAVLRPRCCVYHSLNLL